MSYLLPKEKIHVPISVEKSNLPNNPVYYGKNTSSICSSSQIIRNISSRPGVAKEEVIILVWNLLRNEILSQLRKGNPVSLLDLGILTPVIEGEIPEEMIKRGASPEFSLRFSPSKESLDAVKNLLAKYEKKLSSMPEIIRVSNHFGKTPCSALVPGDFILLEGKSLRFRSERHFDNELSGIFFEPQPHGEVVRVPPERLITKSEKTLRFAVPDLDSSLRYRIYIQKAAVHKDGTIHTVRSLPTAYYPVIPKN